MTAAAATVTSALASTVTVGAEIVTPLGWIATMDTKSLTLSLIPAAFIAIWATDP